MLQSFTEMEVEADFCYLSSYALISHFKKWQAGLILPVHPHNVEHITGVKYTLID